MNNIKIGQEIVINRFYWRKVGKKPHIYMNKEITYKEWVERPCRLKTVYIVGIRTISDGFIFRDDEAPTSFDKDWSFQALLVVDSIYRKPYYVPMTDYRQ